MSSATAVVDADDAFDGDGSASVSEPRLRLTALSFLMLFLELALIRWTAANNIHLAYLTNFVLLASFLGIGIGFLRARSGPNLFPFTPIALGLMVVFVHVFPVDLTTFIGQNVTSPPSSRSVWHATRPTIIRWPSSSASA